MAKLVFLGRLEDFAGALEHELSAGLPLDWSAITTWIGRHCSAELAQLVRGEKVKVALNGHLALDKTGIILTQGDELAFLPPVSGG